DRDMAARKYQTLRLKIVKFFEWRGSTEADEDADKTLDTVARRLHEGENIAALIPYTFSVASKVYLERLRKDEKAKKAMAEMAVLQNSPQFDSEVDEHLMRCLDQCLNTLSANDRWLILAYYSGEGSSRIAFRASLATQMEISMNILRIRTHRIKHRLRQC